GQPERKGPAADLPTSPVDKSLDNPMTNLRQPAMTRVCLRVGEEVPGGDVEADFLIACETETSSPWHPSPQSAISSCSERSQGRSCCTAWPPTWGKNLQRQSQQTKGVRLMMLAIRQCLFTIISNTLAKPMPAPADT